MPRSNAAQLNIRSDFARERVALIAARTGMSAVQVVEEALRAYSPPPAADAPPGLVNRGGLFVKPANGRRPVTLEEAEAEREAVRNEWTQWE